MRKWKERIEDGDEADVDKVVRRERGCLMVIMLEGRLESPLLTELSERAVR